MIQEHLLDGSTVGEGAESKAQIELLAWHAQGPGFNVNTPTSILNQHRVRETFRTTDLNSY